MTGRTVKTQSELNAALTAAGVTEINIDSPRGVWLELRSDNGRYVRAFDSASVRASNSASVHAFGSASVSAFGSASVHAFDSASVSAFDSASVRASNSASVRASNSASVRAFDSASVHAFDSASVHAFDSASVHASNSASVSAFDSASVHASKYVAVHLHSQRVTLTGNGVIIDCTNIDKHDPVSWCEMQGVDITDGTAIVYKAVDAELKSGYGAHYPIGGTVVAADWAPTDACGAGLHFGPTPGHAERYFDGDKPQFLACHVAIAEAVGITGSAADTAKIKARSCVVLHEVDVHGRPLVPVTEATS